MENTKNIITPFLLLLLFCPACLCPCPALHTCSLHSCGFLLAACVPPSSALAPAAASPPVCRGAGGRPQPLPCSHPSSSSCRLAAGASPSTLQLRCLPLSAASRPAPVLPGLRFTGCTREPGGPAALGGPQGLRLDTSSSSFWWTLASFLAFR